MDIPQHVWPWGQFQSTNKKTKLKYMYNYPMNQLDMYVCIQWKIQETSKTVNYNFL